ncbi:MAG: PAS domain-containing protein [Proteobacteria bacterium]|nr:PAS domain-containing protein [Pseudomonadota bacterium]
MIEPSIETYKSIADGIAILLHPFAEVVIHDLSSQTIVHLVNNISKREVGSPSLLDSFETNQNQKVVGPYEKLNWDGRKLKSITISIQGEDDQVVGLMCINLDCSGLFDVFSVLQTFLKPEGMLEKPDEVFKDDWQEKINLFIHSWLKENNLNLNSLNKSNRKKIIEIINDKGGFKGKNAATYVGGILGLGRATVYKYLKELKDA